MTQQAQGSDEIPTIPESEFGLDHDILLLSIETRCVDHRGRPDVENMRCNHARHPYGTVRQRSFGWDDKHTTRLLGRAAPSGHDDWDCIEDFCAAGLLVCAGTGMNPIFILTSRGWNRVQRLRRERAERSLKSGRTQGTRSDG